MAAISTNDCTWSTTVGVRVVNVLGTCIKPVLGAAEAAQ
jgi:hypothetical protein